MLVEFTKRFSKYLDNLQNDVFRSKLRDVVNEVINAKTIRDIKSIKKLKGHNSAYRIRLGDYRIGLFIEDGRVLFAACEHRKDIYDKFP